jgi:hypothetical protein
VLRVEADDKCKIPISEPGKKVFACERQKKTFKSTTSVCAGTDICSQDHDAGGSVCCAIPTALLMTDISELTSAYQSTFVGMLVLLYPSY